MSHEQSDTIQGRDQRWYNVYGTPTGAPQPMPLPQIASFERPSYATSEEAVNKAQWRSQLGHGQYPEQAPQYGFSNSYQPSPQAQLFGQIIQALQDPRNAWMGTGMAGGTIRGLGGLRGLFGGGREAGGFNVTTRKMIKDMPELKYYQDAHKPPRTAQESAALEKFGFDPETSSEIANTRLPGPRGGFMEQVELDNTLASQLRTFPPRELAELRESLLTLDPIIQDNIRRTYAGQGALLNETRMAPYKLEGPPQPEMMYRMGFNKPPQ
jgi:hypothetical protein